MACRGSGNFKSIVLSLASYWNTYSNGNVGNDPRRACTFPLTKEPKNKNTLPLTVCLDHEAAICGFIIGIH